MRGKIIILEEVNRIHPYLPKCNMFLPWKPPQRVATLHKNMHLGLGEEVKMSVRGRGAIRGRHSGVTGICTPPIHVIIIQIPGKCAHGIG